MKAVSYVIEIGFLDFDTAVGEGGQNRIWIFSFNRTEVCRFYQICVDVLAPKGELACSHVCRVLAEHTLPKARRANVLAGLPRSERRGFSARRYG